MLNDKVSPQQRTAITPLQRARMMLGTRWSAHPKSTYKHSPDPTILATWLKSRKVA